MTSESVSTMRLRDLQATETTEVSTGGPFFSLVRAGDVYWLSDEFNNRLLRFSVEGAELPQILEAGDTLLNAPKGLLVVDGVIWLCDSGNDRVILFEPDGSERSIINADVSGSPIFFRPLTCTFVDGRIAVLNGDSEDLVMLSTTGQPEAITGGRKTSYGSSHTFPTGVHLPRDGMDDELNWNHPFQLHYADSVFWSTDVNALHMHDALGKRIMRRNLSGSLVCRGLVSNGTAAAYIDELTGYLYLSSGDNTLRLPDTDIDCIGTADDNLLVLADNQISDYPADKVFALLTSTELEASSVNTNSLSEQLTSLAALTASPHKRWFHVQRPDKMLEQLPIARNREDLSRNAFVENSSRLYLQRLKESLKHIFETVGHLLTTESLLEDPKRLLEALEEVVDKRKQLHRELEALWKACVNRDWAAGASNIIEVQNQHITSTLQLSLLLQMRDALLHVEKAVHSLNHNKNLSAPVPQPASLRHLVARTSKSDEWLLNLERLYKAQAHVAQQDRPATRDIASVIEACWVAIASSRQLHTRLDLIAEILVPPPIHDLVKGLRQAARTSAAERFEALSEQDTHSGTQAPGVDTLCAALVSSIHSHDSEQKNIIRQKLQELISKNMTRVLDAALRLAVAGQPDEALHCMKESKAIAKPETIVAHRENLSASLKACTFQILLEEPERHAADISAPDKWSALYSARHMRLENRTEEAADKAWSVSDTYPLKATELELLFEAFCWEKRGDWLEIVRRQLALRRHSAESLNILMLFARHNEAEKALNIFHHEGLGATGDEKSYLVLARLHHQLGDVSKGISALDEHDDRFVPSAESLRIRRTLLLSLGENVAAESITDILRTMTDYDDQERLFTAQQLFARGEDMKAARVLEDISWEQPPGAMKALLLYRALLRRKGEPNLQLLERTAARHPGVLPLVHELLHLALWSRPEQCLRLVHCCDHQKLFAPLISGFRGAALVQSGNHDIGRDLLRSALESVPTGIYVNSLLLAYGVSLAETNFSSLDNAFLLNGSLARYGVVMQTLRIWSWYKKSPDKAVEAIGRIAKPGNHLAHFYNYSYYTFLKEAGRIERAAEMLSASVKLLWMPWND